MKTSEAGGGKGTRGIKHASPLERRWKSESVEDKNVRAKLGFVKVISRHKIVFDVSEKENVYKPSCQKAADGTRLLQISSFFSFPLNIALFLTEF